MFLKQPWINVIMAPCMEKSHSELSRGLNNFSFQLMFLQMMKILMKVMIISIFYVQIYVINIFKSSPHKDKSFPLITANKRQPMIFIIFTLIVWVLKK